MRLGLDAMAVTRTNLTGMGSYALHLTQAMLGLDTEHEFVVYCMGEVPEAFRRFQGRVEFRVCTWTKNRKLAEQAWLGRAARCDRLDVLHCICSLPVFFRPRCATVQTVHGLSWRVIPEVFSFSQRTYWQQVAERTMPKATRLLAISHWTQVKIGELLNLPADRIDVVHHGVDQSGFGPIEDAAELQTMRERHGLPKRYVLFVGSTLPVKNLPALVRAFSTLVAGGANPDLGLVIAGIKAWGQDAAEAAVKAEGIEERVMFTGRFPAEDLTRLFCGSEMFVLPSLYEGFGLPIVEAFACGVPVVCSDASCLPEIAGDAALQFAVEDEGGLAEAMGRVLSEPGLSEAMIEKGFRRAGEFDWTKTARETLAVYERASASYQAG